MSKTQSWSSEDLAALHGETIRGLYDEGLGRKSLAKAITLRTGIPCSSGVMCRTMKALGLSGRSAGAAGRHAATRVLARLEGLDGSALAEDVSSVDPGDGEIPIEDLIASRIQSARRKHVKAAAHKRTIELPARPTGIMVFGDPHVDNEGCDWELLTEHVELVNRTEGVLAACVGDVQDNWIGRLQRLYAKSSVLATDGWRLSQWFLESMPWLTMVGGNHDQWAHAAGADPLGWISKQAKVMCYADDEIRLTLRWKGRPELEPLVWICRHDFPGRSWFHPTHGPHKEAMLDGKCHLLTAGHIHQWGQLTTEQRHERISHSLRVRGYKRDDSHARALGFHEQSHGAAALVVLDPEAAEPGRIKTFWDLEHGCDYLTWLRSR